MTTSKMTRKKSKERLEYEKEMGDMLLDIHKKVKDIENKYYFKNLEITKHYVDEFTLTPNMMHALMTVVDNLERMSMELHSRVKRMERKIELLEDK